MQDVVFLECCFEILFSQCVCLVESNGGAGGNFQGRTTVARLHRVELWVNTTYMFVPCSFGETFYLGTRL